MACALITAATAAANLSLPRADVCTARVRSSRQVARAVVYYKYGERYMRTTAPGQVFCDGIMYLYDLYFTYHVCHVCI